MESRSENSEVERLKHGEIVTSTMVNDKLLMLKHQATEAKKVAPHINGSRRFVVEKRSETEELLKQVSVTYYPDITETKEMRVVWDVTIRDYSHHVVQQTSNVDLFNKFRIVEKDGRYATYRAVRGEITGRRKVWKEIEDNGFAMGQLANDLQIDKAPDISHKP